MADQEEHEAISASDGKALHVEVDGEYWGECEIYEDVTNGPWHGYDEKTSADDKVRGFLSNKSGPIFFLSAFRRHDDKSISGIVGAYRHGEFAMRDGTLLYRVWDRIA